MTNDVKAGKESNMIICKCDSCRYIFRCPIFPVSCPDCGKRNVRKAEKIEVKSYWQDQALIAGEIRAGLYAAGSI